MNRICRIISGLVLPALMAGICEKPVSSQEYYNPQQNLFSMETNYFDQSENYYWNEMFSSDVYSGFGNEVYRKFGQEVYYVYTAHLAIDDYENVKVFLEDGTVLNLGKIFTNVVIGTGVMALTAVVFPGTVPVTAMIISELKASAIFAAIQGAISYAKNGDIHKSLNKAFEGMSDGYKWGAFFTFGSRTVKQVYINSKFRKIPCTEELAASSAEYERILQEHGKDIADLFEVFGDDFIKILERLKGAESYLGKVFVQVMEKTSEKTGRIIIGLAKKLDDPRQLARLVRYMDACGEEGIGNVVRWKGIIPEKITHSQLKILKRINNGPTKKLANQLKNLKGFKLTAEEIEMCLNTPEKLIDLVQQRTGKGFRDGYQEFFIRMKKAGQTDQIKKLWSNKEVRELIKNRGIRAGGVHEWLMAKNFEDFLVNPKWGTDGEYLLTALEKLVQRTENVIFRNGGKHGAEWSATFHNKLGDVISSCDNAAEVYEKIQTFAKQELSTDAYKEFVNIMYRSF